MKRKYLLRLLINNLEISGLICDYGNFYEDIRNLVSEEFFDGNMASWSRQYSTIYLTDMLEENRFRFKHISKERADYWIAQANFAKALMYFDVIRKWGEAPWPRVRNLWNREARARP